MNTLCMGGANLDIVGTSTDIFSPGDSNPGLVQYSAGGVARNIAENLQRLGTPTHLLSVVGNDLGRDVILRNCAEVGINTDLLITQDQGSTGTYLAINNQIGGLLAAIADMGLIATMTAELLTPLLPKIQQAQRIVLDGNLPATTLFWLSTQVFTSELVADAVSAAKAARLRPLLPKLSLLKANRNEAIEILGHKADDKTLATELVNRGVKRVLFSRGAQGAMLASADGVVDLHAKRSECLSDTGAGDALLAGFIAAQGLLSSVEHQLEFALACASFTLTSDHSVHPELTVSKIRQVYLNHLPKSAWLVL